jgi:hypothetical protein
MHLCCCVVWLPTGVPAHYCHMLLLCTCGLSLLCKVLTWVQAFLQNCRHNSEMETLMCAPPQLQGPARKEGSESWARTAHQATRVVQLLVQLLWRELEEDETGGEYVCLPQPGSENDG